MVPRLARTVLLLASFILALGGVRAARADSFVNFESGHVRPLALSFDGSHLFAVNTPDNRLEVFAVGAGTLTRVGEVQVGLEPVAVAARTATEVWVVNHLSDSVSVVDVSNPAQPRVKATLLVGDEPRDIVFGRADRSRSFITCAHRGQNRPGNPQLTTPGVGRADVWVHDATTLGFVTIVTLFGDTPRALAVDPSGSPVYAAVFHSGNQTTTINQRTVTAAGGVPPFPVGSTPGAPDTGLIVKFDPATNRWEDERGAAGPDWSASVPFSLPDEDVFVIDANAATPALAAPPNAVTGVGTVLFSMAVRPDNGKLYVANTDARNNVRFEDIIGVTGHIAESRLTVVSGTTPNPIHLNPHIDYSVSTGPAAEVEQSLAFPVSVAFSADGHTVFVAALGSGKVGRFDSDGLEAGTVIGNEIQIPVGGGPSGLALDEANHQLFVMNRFDETISIVDTDTNTQQSAVPLRYDPEPPAVKNGRHFLYDAKNTSGHGDSACASCHIFGDFDSLAWDLGSPFGAIVPNPNPFVANGPGNPFHPLKGPMTTQSLRGMANAGPMHWRGDRTGGTTGGDPLDETLAFKAFNPAFQSLLGHATQLSDADMQAFTDFVLTIAYPPNPNRSLDGVLTTQEANGQSFFLNTVTDGRVCNGCHTLPLGTAGLSSFEGETQEFKVPHLRNLYQKVGMFGVPSGIPGIPATGNLGPQVRGFGMLHDGSIATVFNFLQSNVFNNFTNALRRAVEAFLLGLDTGLRPVVGQQTTLTPSNQGDTAVTGRIDFLVVRAGLGDCDLVVKGRIGGFERGWLYDGAIDAFHSDRAAEPPLALATLEQLATTATQELTFTCVPPGSGTRIAIDRDEDGALDQDERDGGSDPADPSSLPPPAPAAIRSASFKLRDDNTPPINLERRTVSFKSAPYKGAPSGVVLPLGGSSGDPTAAGPTGGAVLTVYNSNGSGEKVVVSLPASNWSMTGSAASPTGYKYKDSKRLLGPISSATLTGSGRLSISGKGAAWLYTLDEPAQVRMALRLTLGSQPPMCAEAPAQATGNPPSTANHDEVDKFDGQPNSPGPVVCPPVPGA
jgi:YVTN family beta-propeller protein